MEIGYVAFSGMLFIWVVICSAYTHGEVGVSILAGGMSSSPNNATSPSDGAVLEALFELKRSINDPLNVLGNWMSPNNDTAHVAINFCSWSGISCSRDDISSANVLFSINLSNSSLSGSLSPAVGRLASLQELNLGFNNFSGEIPAEIANCSSLRYLNLTDNSLGGVIPLQLWLMPNLETLVLWNNFLEGNLPSEIAMAPKLQHLDLGGNQFSGVIPAQIGDLSSLVNLTLAGNYLEGNVPASLGKLSNLEWIYLGYNMLNGSIPGELGFLSNLNHLDLVFNNLTGSIPSSLVNLTKLQYVFLYSNGLSGEIPEGIGNLTELISLDLSNNSLRGEIPDLSGLKNLQILNLFTNNLVGAIPSCVLNLPSLQVLALWQNQLSGTIPSDLGLNASLTVVDLSTNHLTGSIPKHLCNSGQLFKIILFNNQLSGMIPNSLGECKSLQRVRIQNNSFYGSIPAGIWSLPLLYYLELSDNILSGDLTGSFLGINAPLGLQVLHLSNNHLSGTLPSELGRLAKLVDVDLSDNLFSGEITSQLGNIPHLAKLDLSNNAVSGQIPPSLGACKELVTVKLQRNKLIGQIPSQMAGMQALGYLDLSQNRLSGRLPPQLSDVKSLNYLNVSYNFLSGPVPEGGVFEVVSSSSILGNADLCGNSLLGLKPCSKVHRPGIGAWLVGAGLFSGVLAALACFYLRSRRIRSKAETESLKQQNLELNAAWSLVLFEKTLPLKAADIVRAMEEKSSEIYERSPETYKGLTKNGQAFCVVKYRYSIQPSTISEELYALGRIQHQNIVRLLGVCLSSDSQLLVHEYMANGSLASALSCGSNSKQAVTWEKRTEIAAGIATALAYLHANYSNLHPHVLSGISLTTEHIMLDENFEAHIQLKPTSLAERSNFNRKTQIRSKLGNSIHAVPDECGYSAEVAKMQADVHSFGKILMELVSGRSPGKSTIREIRSQYGVAVGSQYWVHRSLSEEALGELDRVVDRSLRTGQLQRDIEILQFLWLATLCTREPPPERPSIQEVVRMLTNISAGSSPLDMV